MGNDLVMYCYDGNADHDIGMSWNFADPYTTTILDNPHDGFYNATYRRVDGILSCTFTMFQTINVKTPEANISVPFDLSNPYFLLAAKGPLNKGGPENKILG